MHIERMPLPKPLCLCLDPYAYAQMPKPVCLSPDKTSLEKPPMTPSGMCVLKRAIFFSLKVKHAS